MLKWTKNPCGEYLCLMCLYVQECTQQRMLNDGQLEADVSGDGWLCGQKKIITY